jgi:hypothetical protein
MEKEVKKSIVKTPTVILAIVMLAIPLAFFALLNSITQSGFGIREILFSLALAAISTTFLVWTKSVIIKNPYLGLAIGIGTLIAFEYGLFIKFKGPYTITFAILTALIIAAYLGFYFIKFRKKEKMTQDFNDSL